jgi:hypothetical protein
MPEKTSGQQAIRIDGRDDADRQVLVHPENDDIFVVTGRLAIEGCRLGIGLQVWLDELEGR